MESKIIQFKKNKIEDILVTLVENISDENGKLVPLSELDRITRYHFQIRLKGNRVINYPPFGDLSKNIKREIQSLKKIGISGEYFIAPIKRRKIRW